MKTLKISLADMQGKLTRSEMKNIMGGTEPVDPGCVGNSCGPHGNGTCETAVSGCKCSDNEGTC